MAHLLIVSTPSPLAYLGWIARPEPRPPPPCCPLAIRGIPLAAAVAAGVLHLVIGMAIGSLVVGRRDRRHAASGYGR